MAEAEFIEREAASRVLCDACGNAACPKGLIPRCSYYEKMQSIPAADVRPVKWIPVTERLPDTGVDVLVKFPHNMAVASIDIGEWVVNSGDGWCTDINLAGGEKNPTHWMPLPEPPKEET